MLLVLQKDKEANFSVISAHVVLEALVIRLSQALANAAAVTAVMPSCNPKAMSACLDTEYVTLSENSSHF